MKDFFFLLKQRLLALHDYSNLQIETTFKETAASLNLKPGEVLQLFRVILSGQAGGVELFPMAALFGKEEVDARLSKALNELPS